MSLIRDAIGRHAVLGSHQAILHVGRQARDRAAGDSRRGEALAPVAGDLKDGPQPVAKHVLVGVERLDSPDRPALSIVAKVPRA